MIYLAIPYTHPDPAVEQDRFEIANHIAAKLMAAGIHVFSPISHSHPIRAAGKLPGTWDYWEAYDRKILAICDTLMVVCAPGWQESKGVRAEMEIADKIGIPTLFLGLDSLDKVLEDLKVMK